MVILQLQKDAESQINGLQRYLTAIPTSMSKNSTGIGLPCSASSSTDPADHGSDILRWTNEDAVQFHHPNTLSHFGKTQDTHFTHFLLRWKSPWSLQS